MEFFNSAINFKFFKARNLLFREIKKDDFVLQGDQESKYMLEIVDSEYLLLFKYSNAQRLYQIYLLRLDLDDLKCQLLETAQLNEFRFPKLVIDRKNPHRFAFCWFEFGDHRVRLVQIKNSSFDIEPQISLHDDMLGICRLDGDKMQVLHSGLDPDNPNLDILMDLYLHEPKDDRFSEFSLIPGQNYPPLTKLFDIKREGRLNGTSLEVNYRKMRFLFNHFCLGCILVLVRKYLCSDRQ
jgi:hypothetical protein